MDTRGAAVVVLAVLLPVPALADRHTMECFLGGSPEKQQAVSMRASCAVDPWDLLTASSPAQYGSRGLLPNAAPDQDPDATATKDGGSELKSNSVFLVGEISEYITGTDSGTKIDGWMLGGRV